MSTIEVLLWGVTPYVAMCFAVVPVAVRPAARCRGHGRRVDLLQASALVGLLLFAIWPFTRLVHAFTAPLGYLFRPYIVYRSRPSAAPAPPVRAGKASGSAPAGSRKNRSP